MTLPSAKRDPFSRSIRWLSQIRCTPSRLASRVIVRGSEQRIIGVNSGGSPRSSPSHPTLCRASLETCVRRYEEIGDETMQAYWACPHSSRRSINGAPSIRCVTTYEDRSSPGRKSRRYRPSGNERFPDSSMGWSCERIALEGVLATASTMYGSLMVHPPVPCDPRRRCLGSDRS